MAPLASLEREARPPLARTPRLPAQRRLARARRSGCDTRVIVELEERRGELLEQLDLSGRISGPPDVRELALAQEPLGARREPLKAGSIVCHRESAHHSCRYS